MKKIVLGLSVIILLSLLLAKNLFAGISTILKINQASSYYFVSYKYVNYEDMDYISSLEKYPISGNLTLYIDDSIPDLPQIHFEAIDIVTPTLPRGPFNFPNHYYYGEFDGTNFLGNDNPCVYWHGGGECSSEGNFGYYSGTFNGESLSMVGSIPIDWDDSYHFSIQATVAPEAISSDLVITSISNIPSSKKRGGKFTIKDIVKNQGDAETGQFTNEYYLSKDTVKSEDDVCLTGKRSILSLGIGKSSDENGVKPVKVRIPSNTPLGIYYVIACADTVSNINESDETNNCKASKKRIRVLK